MLVAYTDGVNEARNDADEEFGEPAARSWSRSTPPAPPISARGYSTRFASFAATPGSGRRDGTGIKTGLRAGS